MDLNSFQLKDHTVKMQYPVSLRFPLPSTDERPLSFKQFKKKEKNYRSENFSTTRTLSPRTVIGIGTTLS